MNIQTMGKQRKMILIAAAAGVIAMFLPWWSISLGIFGGGSVNGMHNEGIVVFLCFMGVVLLQVTGDQTKNLEPGNWALTLIAGTLATAITLITFLNAPSIGDRGVGLYLALAAAVAVVVFAYLHRTAGSTLQEGLNALKTKFTSPQHPSQTDTSPTTKVINPAGDKSKQDV